MCRSSYDGWRFRHGLIRLLGRRLGLGALVRAGIGRLGVNRRFINGFISRRLIRKGLIARLGRFFGWRSFLISRFGFSHFFNGSFVRGWFFSGHPAAGRRRRERQRIAVSARLKATPSGGEWGAVFNLYVFIGIVGVLDRLAPLFF